jgi:uncharacterized protein (DUF2384 family)
MPRVYEVRFHDEAGQLVKTVKRKEMHEAMAVYRLPHVIERRVRFIVKADSREANKDMPAWNRAKRQVRAEYPDISEDSERFWKLVQTLYQSMKAK